MNSIDRQALKRQLEREETFWNCCLELVPVFYACTMMLLVVFLCKYGLYIQDDPPMGPEVHMPARISGVYYLYPAPFYLGLMLALLYPVRRGWNDFDFPKEYHTVDDWRFSSKKALCLMGSLLGAIWIWITQFYGLWDEQIAQKCRLTLLGSGILLAVIGHLIIRLALWRKIEPEQRLSVRADHVCDIISKCCYVFTLVCAISMRFIFPPDGGG